MVPYLSLGVLHDFQAIALALKTNKNQAIDELSRHDTAALSLALSTTRRRNSAEDAGFENSGDEAITEKGKKRRKKDKTADVVPDADEGPLVKTRSMRAVEYAPLLDGSADPNLDGGAADIDGGPDPDGGYIATISTPNIRETDARR
ncbi:hypothetical protein QBC39DRAFT_375524 [Podospora conica]|nr:hypothetical protein QBC39DRAFT_375524 [Schizothecium conicum]